MSVISRIRLVIDILLLLCVMTMPLWWSPEPKKTQHQFTVKTHHDGKSDLVFIPLPHSEVTVEHFTVWSDHDRKQTLTMDMFDYSTASCTYISLLNKPLQLHTNQPYTRYVIDDLLSRKIFRNTLVLQVSSHTQGVYPVYISYTTVSQK